MPRQPNLRPRPRTGAGGDSSSGEEVSLDTITPEELADVRRQAAAGDLDAKLMLAATFQIGAGGVEKDERLAFVMLEKLAPQLPAARFALATALYDGIGTPEDYEAAAHIFRQFAEAGDPQAMKPWAQCQERGHGVPKDLAGAKKWYRRAARKGDATAEARLAELAPDAEESAELYRRGAERGDRDAMLQLAHRLRHGDGVAQDVARAEYWARRALAAGLGEAGYVLVSWLGKHAGPGTPRDTRRALRELLRQAVGAEVPSATAQYVLARQLNPAYKDRLPPHHKGTIEDPAFILLEPDAAESAMFLERAAENGSARAQVDLFLAHRKGGHAGIRPEPERALPYLLQAAEAGDVTAQFLAATEYAAGGDQPDQRELRRHWCRAAAEQWHQKANTMLAMDYFGMFSQAGEEQGELQEPRLVAMCLMRAIHAEWRSQHFSQQDVDEATRLLWEKAARHQAVARTICTACGRKTAKRRCASCDVAVFCDLDCMRLAWKKHHKQCCGAWAEERKAAAAAEADSVSAAAPAVEAD